jgi:uncharacterized protein YggE
LLLVAVLGVVACAVADEAPFHRTLAVIGTAEVRVTPDICYMSFLVTTRNRSAGQAYDDNNVQMGKINSAVRARGIETKDLQTINFTLAPKYHYETNTSKRVFDDYLVNNTLYVSVRDLTKVPAVLDAAMNAGAAEIGGVTFTIENPEKYKASARIDAIKAARGKAGVIAEQTGVKILKPISISESAPNRYPLTNAPAIISGGIAEREAPSLEPGEVKLTCTVYITYEIE